MNFMMANRFEINRLPTDNRPNCFVGTGVELGELEDPQVFFLGVVISNICDQIH